jgi:sulfur carrier protein ThiS
LKIHVKYLGFSKLPEIERDPVVDIPEGSTLSDLYQRLGINTEGRGAIQAFINNDTSWKATKLRDNDQVTIVSIVTGG